MFLAVFNEKIWQNIWDSILLIFLVQKRNNLIFVSCEKYSGSGEGVGARGYTESEDKHN